MCDGPSLARIRKTWSSYRTASMSKEHLKSYEQRFKSTIQRARDTKEARIGKGQVLTGFRSTAPVSMLSLAELSQLYYEFWDTGTTDSGSHARDTASYPNPMFAASVEDTFTLHYGTDPLLGFHLATGYAPLLPESPLQVGSCNVSGVRTVIEFARVQFQAWGSAFRNRVPENMTIRFFAGDALSFCHALLHRRSVRGDSPPHMYRDPFHSEPLLLDDEDYGVTGGAPPRFNVIDTSNLLDHLGALNVLVASSPLLSDELAATLYTETLVKREDSLKAMSDELLCGHFSTISILLDLFPIEYWTNATAISGVDEAMFDAICRMMGSAKDHDGQMRCRFAWKRAPTQSVSLTTRTSSRLHFKDIDLATILFRVYQKMFQHENMGLLFSSISLQRLKNNSCPHYHRGSLAAFLALVKGQVSANWNKVMDQFLDFVENDSSILMGRNYIQELYLYLHIFDIHSVPILKTNSHGEEKPLNLSLTRNWEDSLAVSCIILKVPRAALKAFREVPYQELGTPLVHGVLQSSNHFDGRPWQNVFSVVQLAFGEVVTSGSRHGDDLSVIIHEDEYGWLGKSPLVASFYVPSWITRLEPQTANVAFGIQSTPQSSRTFVRHFGVELNIYETHLGNEKNAYVTRHAPNQSGRPCLCRPLQLNVAVLQPADDLFDTMITPAVNIETAQIMALTGRVELKSEAPKTCFATVPK